MGDGGVGGLDRGNDWTAFKLDQDVRSCRDHALTPAGKIGLRKLLAERAEERRRSIDKQAWEIEARRTAPFQSVL
jgi:hypothetical protein